MVNQRKGRGARQRVKNGQALMPTLKYLFRLAGPKILTLLALAIARTLLSNRLARLQACLKLLRGCCQSMCGHTAMSQPDDRATGSANLRTGIKSGSCLIHCSHAFPVYLQACVCA